MRAFGDGAGGLNALDGAAEGRHGPIARVFERVFENEKPNALKACAFKIRRLAALQRRQRQRRILDRPAQWPDGIEAFAQGHHAPEGEAAVGCLEPHEIIPGRRDAHRATGIRADGKRCEAEGHRGGRARARAPRYAGGIVHRWGRGRHGIVAEAREGELAHVGLAEADHPGVRRVLQHLRILPGHPPAQKSRARFGEDAGCIEEILPARRHAIERAQAQASAGARCCRTGLCHCPILRQAGIDPILQRMALDRI